MSRDFYLKLSMLQDKIEEEKIKTMGIKHTIDGIRR